MLSCGLSGLFFRKFSQSKPLELSLSEAGELINTFLKGAGPSVVQLDFIQISFEDNGSKIILIGEIIFPAIDIHVCIESGRNGNSLTIDRVGIGYGADLSECESDEGEEDKYWDVHIILM